MSWTNGQPSPAEYEMRELRPRPLYKILDPDHARRVIKRAAPLLSRILNGVDEGILAVHRDVAHDLLTKIGSLNVELWSNNTFTIARLGAELKPGRISYGVATRKETDSPDISIALRLATARALHALLLESAARVVEQLPEGELELVEDELLSLNL